MTHGAVATVSDPMMPDWLDLMADEAQQVATEMVGTRSSSDQVRVTVAPLRRLHSWCETYLERATEPQDQFVLFFLATFVHDVFFNLTGDVVYLPATRQVQHGFFLQLASHVADMARAIKEQRRDDVPDVFRAMVAEYIATVREINNLTTDDEDATHEQER